MVEKKEAIEYLAHVQDFLDLNFENGDGFIDEVMEHEPEGRVVFDAEKELFRLGMCHWDVDRTRGALNDIQDAIREFMLEYAKTGSVTEGSLNRINAVCHDLRIQYNYVENDRGNLKLNYVVPDSRIAWEEGKCPHCGETVTIHICPDPIPVRAYEAIINTFRLASRNLDVSYNADDDKFFIE